MKIEVKNTTKRFNRLSIFKKVSFSIDEKGVYIVSGRNGSGKSTFLKCLLGILPLTKGEILLRVERIGFVAPYYQLFNELSAKQNILLVASSVNIEMSEDEISKRMEAFQLSGKQFVLLKNYSSGMMQRFRYLIACLNDPDLLVLDEPSANLDSEGKKFVSSLVQDYSTKAIVIIATNETDELSWGEEILALS